MVLINPTFQLMSAQRIHTIDTQTLTWTLGFCLNLFWGVVWEWSWVISESVSWLPRTKDCFWSASTAASSGTPAVLHKGRCVGAAVSHQELFVRNWMKMSLSSQSMKGFSCPKTFSTCLQLAQLSFQTNKLPLGRNDEGFFHPFFNFNHFIECTERGVRTHPRQIRTTCHRCLKWWQQFWTPHLEHSFTIERWFATIQTRASWTWCGNETEKLICARCANTVWQSSWWQRWSMPATCWSTSGSECRSQAIFTWAGSSSSHAFKCHARLL